jgi:NADH:ubiquinone oxidoreductase subunit 6 (subunit J)
VYIGAIVILFLFMIMLLSLETPFYNLSLNQFMKLNLLFSIKASIFSVVIVDQGFHKFDVFFFRQYKKNFVANDFIFEFSYFANDSLIFNNLLYTQFFFHFIILGFILLVGMIGSIALTLATKSN